MTAPTQTAPTEPSTQAYFAAVAAIVAGAIGTAGLLASLQSISTGGAAAWKAFVELLFRELSRDRSRAAEVARNYVDEQRRLRGLDPVPVDLVGYDLKYFQASMEPIRKEAQKWADVNPKKAVETVQVFAAHEVEGAARQQVMASVDAVVNLDSPRKGVVGWARVATGRETCAFCLMLVSRGPVYRHADTAGSAGTDTEVLNGFADMKAFHRSCDCRVVPVFDRTDWPGRDEYKAALKQWNDAVPDKVDEGKKYRVRQKDGTYRMVTLKQGEARTREALINIRQGFAKA